jgi:hypothetical protein
MGIFKYSSWCFPQPSTEQDRIDCCGAVPIKPLRPDLAIYSQDEKLAAGAAPTWLNPDITPDIIPSSLKFDLFDFHDPRE